jgi:putative Ca2+/H+ antiporter (TMEM165/GDT1 family)
MAMKHSRYVIFVGALSALALMTVLSAAFGFLLPNLLPRVYTHWASVVLFVYFGVKLLKEGAEMEGGTWPPSLSPYTVRVDGSEVHSQDGPLDT